MKVSVIINTINRPNEISGCLDSLAGQTDKDFEVVVVDQSKNRDTKRVCSPYNLKYYRIKKRKNISVSRNFGINMASGEVIAFIDDDAKARPDWIEQIKSVFTDPEVVLLAGRVINYSDDENPVTQFQNGIVSSFGHTQDIRPTDEKRYQRGHAGWYTRPMGANAIFRKSAVTKIGGFDEFFEYIHDETDLAVRLIKNGGKGVYADQLIVEHYPAKSHNRKRKNSSNWYALAKNNLYFGLKNGNGFPPLKVIRSLWRILSGEGVFLILIRLLIHGKMHPMSFVLNWIKSAIGAFRGFQAGILFRRKTREFSEPGKFVLFRRR